MFIFVIVKMKNMLRVCSLIFILVLVKALPFDERDDRYMHPHFGPSVSTKYDDLLRDEKDPEYWSQIGMNITLNHKENFLNGHWAKNVIFFLGDGMSLPTLAAARAYMGQMEGKPGEEYELSFEKFPITGLSKTYCVDSQVADSACTSTAYLTGVKANYETIGVTAAVKVDDCDNMINKKYHTSSIGKWFQDFGRSSGIVTTTRVTHASPAGAYSHVANRDWESDTDVIRSGRDPKKCRDIAYQLMNEEPGKKFKVIMGGGRAEFLPNNIDDEEGIKGYRSDGVNLIEAWKNMRKSNNESYEYVWNKKDLLKVKDDTDYLLGLFESSHCQYHLDADPATEPTLTEMVQAAIKVLSKDKNGYFLFVEGGRIDHGHHDNRAHYALDETAEFSKAIAKAVELTDRKDTLIVVTSDHAHAMTLNGYPTRGNPILGKQDRYLGNDKIPYLTLSYANGPGYRKEVDGSRVDVTQEDMDDLKFYYPAMVPLNSETHGGDDVGVFALGPQQHLFSGVYEQSAIPHIMSYAACLDNKFSACSASALQISILTFTVLLYHLCRSYL